MTGNEYQDLASRTLAKELPRQYSKAEITILLRALWMAGKACTIADHLKKAIFHDHGINEKKLREDLQDLTTALGSFAVGQVQTADEQLSAGQIFLLWNTIGLVGEAGEVADYVADNLINDKGFRNLDNEKMVKELGDVIWYAGGVCTKMGYQLDDVMETNIEKLRKRYPEGFKTLDSINRPEDK